jgi:hypothetical protein
MPITALPTPPSRADAANFSTRADAFLSALPTFATEANATATAANTSATNAAASATTASTQATNAAASATSAAASYDAFDDRYLGSKAANPTLDNDGAALLTGALHWNTTGAEMRVWTGTAWVAAYVSAGAYAPLASPAFTGVPTAPTAAADTNTTQAATTAFVLGQASAATPIIDGIAAIGTSLRYARADHVHPTDTSRAALASPTFTGVPAAPTAAQGTNTTQLATTAHVFAGLALQASLTGATFTGAVAGPTAAAGTNTTQLATTAFVQGVVRPSFPGNPSASFTAADTDNNTHKVASGAAQTLTLGNITAGTAFTIRFTTAWSLAVAGGLSKNGAAPAGVTTGAVAANSLITFLHEGAGVWAATGGGLS